MTEIITGVHHTYVQTTVHREFFAVCAHGGCEWMGPTRTAERVAREDADEHARHTGWQWSPVLERMVPRA